METYIEQSQIALRNAIKERTKRSQMFKGKLFSKQTMMESEQNEFFQTKTLNEREYTFSNERKFFVFLGKLRKKGRLVLTAA